MIRFACASCQKTLSAPDDKAGMRFSCPGCKKPVQVPAAPSSVMLPAAAASSPADGGSVRPTLRKRFLVESGAVTLATFRQSLKPFTLVFEIWRRSRLRKKAVTTQFALGQRMNESQIGDQKLRARIKALGERIHSIQDVKGDAR